MSDKSKIEWCDATWNPVSGCSKVSEGCRNCYAERLSHRYKWTEKPWSAQNAGENVKLHPERLDQPLRWRRPRKIFVNSMSDLFHEAVPFEFIDKVFAVMASANQHIFQILTKRPERMREYILSRAEAKNREGIAAWMGTGFVYPAQVGNERRASEMPWPLSNVWLGVSVENQKAADERIPLLLETPAAVRFLSCEPLLGPVDLRCVTVAKWNEGGEFLDSLTGEHWLRDGFEKELDHFPKISWCIVGGESGPGSRPMHPDWVRSIRDQCQAAGVPFFFKQRGEYTWDNFDPYYGYGEDSGKWDEYICLNGERGFCKINDPDGVWINWTGSPDETAVLIRRIGKKKAGRLLDGREWNELPGA
ncbi:phage Gp37/Gp68 family protein [Bacillaceae bacterium]